MSDRELSVSEIVSGILYIRGQKVMLDSDLASMYGVETKVLNQAVNWKPGMIKISVLSLKQLSK
jgi:hypothetical protein